MFQEESGFTLRFTLEASFADDYEGDSDNRAWLREWESQIKPEVVKAVFETLRRHPSWESHVRNRGHSPLDEIEIVLQKDFLPDGAAVTDRAPTAGTTASAAETRRGLGLYIHIPFCHLRCHFCAFYLHLHSEQAVTRFLRSLELELACYGQQAALQSRQFQTIYFGGGTPTTLRAEQLLRMLDLVRATFDVAADAEITVEGHPDTLSREQLHSLKRAGVTRLSLGAESLDQDELIRVGRPTQATSLARAMAMVREVGFANVNLDLMYGLPGQTLESWQSTLAGVLTFDPTHLSCYALTVEDGTALAQSVAVGARPAPDPDLQTAMEQAAEAQLAAAGYDRYEISNYAKPGWACRHNQLYWGQGDYLGLGPSAESYVNGVRFGNVADLAAYCDALDQGRPPLAHEEPLSVAQQQREAVVFGLRQSAGVERRLVEALSADRRWYGRLNDLLTEGLLTGRDGRIRFTDQGRQLADSVSAALIAAGDDGASRPTP